LNGKTIALHLMERDTIDMVRAILFHRKDIGLPDDVEHRDELRLIFNGKELSVYDLTLTDCSIRKEVILHLSLRSKAGGVKRTIEKKKMVKDDRIAMLQRKLDASSAKIKELEKNPNIYTELYNRFSVILNSVNGGKNVLGDIFAEMSMQELRVWQKTLVPNSNNDNRIRKLMGLLIGVPYQTLQDRIAEMKGMDEDAQNILDYVLEKSPYVGNDGRISWVAFDGVFNALIDGKMAGGNTSVVNIYT
jgi:hypothetical protein